MRSVLSRRTVIGLVAGTMLTSTLVIASAIPSAPAAQAASASVFCDDPLGPAASSPALQSYTPVRPVRLLDTRIAVGGLGVPVEAGCTIRLSVGSDVPANAQAVALTVTAISDHNDFITVYPCALGRPETSNVNYRGGIATANLVVAIPDVNRQICLYSHSRTEVLVDLSGWWSNGPDRFASIAPQRVYDSRLPGGTPLASFRPHEVEIPTSAIPADATTVVINLTTTLSADRGYFTAYPCGGAVPIASNLNFSAREDRAAAAIVGLGPGRRICILSNVASHVIVDVTGYYAPAPAFGPAAALQPTSGYRIVDTRNAVGGPRQKFADGEVRSYDPVAGQSGANEATAVTLNVISSGSTSNGYVTLYPCGGTPPVVSSLNYRAGEIASNLATIELSSSRTVCVLTSSSTDIIIDVFAVMTAPVGSLAERITFDRGVFPPFDPAASDFAIKCAAGTTNVNLGLDLLPGVSATTSTNGSAPVAVGSGVVARPLLTDQILQLHLARGGSQSTYNFRCLPADFPDLSVDRPRTPTPGWYLTTFGIQSPGGPYAVIFDEYGAPVWYKRTSEPVLDFKRLSTGDLAFAPAGPPFGTAPGPGYWITRLDGSTVAKRQTSNTVTYPVDAHDYEETPDGWALLTYPTDKQADLTSLGFGVGQVYADSMIQEVRASDLTEAWQWRFSDHIAPTESTLPLVFPHSPAVDVYHVNAIDRQSDGDYVVTARHLDAVFRVDHASKDIEWVLGGDPNTPGRLCSAASLVTPPQSPTNKCLRIIGDPLNGPKGPHDGRLEGNMLTMMDNRTDGRPSRAVGYRIDTDAMTATMMWQVLQRSGVSGGTLGSVRLAGDGSVLVGWGAPIQPMIDEFASDRVTRLLSISQSPFGYSYRVVKYPKTDFDVNQLRSTAGGATVGPL